jgi:hypothetical protein
MSVVTKPTREHLHAAVLQRNDIVLVEGPHGRLPYRVLKVDRLNDFTRIQFDELGWRDFHPQTPVTVLDYTRGRQFTPDGWY